MLAFHEAVLVVIIDLAVRDLWEKFAQIFEAHPEEAVIRIGVTDLLLEFRCPAVGLIRPVALPLKTAPRITHLYERDLPALFVINLLDGNERVRMSGNKAEFFKFVHGFLILWVASSGHDVVFCVKLE